MNYSIRSAGSADVDAIARVHVESWHTTYAGLMPESYLANLSVENRAAMWRGVLSNPGRQTHLLVAENTDDGAIVGFAGYGPERTGHPDYSGELYVLYLLQNVQRQGIGRALFSESMRGLVALGRPAMLVWVLEGNPAVKFYEAMGGVYVGERTDTLDGLTVRERAYGYALVASESPSAG